MSFTFQSFSLGFTEHVQLRDRITLILQTYFYGVIHAPCIFLSLGKEIENLRDFIEQLINENSNPNSAIFRSDNKLTAQRAVQLAIRGVDKSLSDVENTLRAAKANRGQTEKWWANFAKKLRFYGGDRNFLIALENFRYHTWAFSLVFRPLKKSSMETLLEIAEQNYVYHDELLADLLSTAGEDSMGDEITGRFTEHAEFNGCVFITGFPLEIALRISMYWTFKATAGIRETQISKNFSDEEWLGLLKAYWIFQKLQEDPRSQKMPKEFQAIMVAISTELSFAAKTILEINIALPALHSLINCSDFRILLDDFDDEIEDEASRIAQITANTYSPQSMSHLRTSAVSSRDLGSSQISPVSPHQVFVAAEELDGSPIVMNNTVVEELEGSPIVMEDNITAELEGSPAVMSNTAVHPASYNTYEGYGDEPSRNRSQSSPDKWNMSPQPITLTPPTSPDPQFRRSLSQPEGLGHGGIKNLLPSAGGSLNRGYRDYTVGGSKQPVRILSRSSTVIETTRHNIPPLGISDYRRSLPYRGLPAQNRSNENFRNHLPPLGLANGSVFVGGFGSRNSVSTASASTRPTHINTVYPSTSEHAVVFSGTTITEPPDYGVRPGEVEVMKEGFFVMGILASNICDINSRWDECVVRIFKNHAGDLRILTLREGSVDQRQIPLKDAELIPEYGYRMSENLPVIFIRKAGPGGYSLQSGKRHSISTGLVDLPAVSLYYKFKTVLDMFEFQRALLGERVEAEIQVVRTIRYKRGLLDGENSNHTCRIQLWKEQPADPRSPGLPARPLSVSGPSRSGFSTSLLKPRSTRVVMFMGQVLITLFVTDDIVIEEKSRSSTLRIKPSSYSTFGSRSSVKACVLGNRELSGGIRLDKEGLFIEDEEKFDDFKWFEIDFKTHEEMALFKDAFDEALQDRRRERTEIEDLRKKAASGMKASEWPL